MDFRLLYLMTRTEAVAITVGWFAILSFLALLALYVARAVMSIDSSMRPESYATTVGSLKFACRALLAVSAACSLLSVLLPTRNDWYVMIGGYYVTHVEGIDKLPANVVGAANEFLERYQAGQDGPEVPKAKKHGGGA